MLISTAFAVASAFVLQSPMASRHAAQQPTLEFHPITFETRSGKKRQVAVEERTSPFPRAMRTPTTGGR